MDTQKLRLREFGKHKVIQWIGSELDSIPREGSVHKPTLLRYVAA